MFIPFQDKIDDVYVYLQEDFKIEDNGDLNNDLGIDLDRQPYGSIHLSHPYLTQSIINLMPDTGKSNYKPTPAVTSPLEKNGGFNLERMTVTTDQ